MDPIAQFADWFDEARACAAITEPTAMTLATATRDGKPSARIVLLKDFSAEGFIFYTNGDSRKGSEFTQNPHAALMFYWMPLDKQVRIEGTVSAIDPAQSDVYFASRPRLKQAGAWASLLSLPLENRATLEARVKDMEKKYEGRDIPRPPHWGGFALRPERIEFWHQRDARLHERDVFTRTLQGWDHTLLYP